MKTNQNNKKTVPTQEQIEVVCRQRARHFWNWLTWSLVYYVVINLFLIAINWFTSPHYWWVLWVIAGRGGGRVWVLPPPPRKQTNIN